MVDTPLVAVRGLRKRYGGVVAVDGMNLTVRRGAIHAVVGENGAGKSTLMKVLAGVVRPDVGEIEFDGRRAEIVSPAVARQHGVGIVYQELSLFPQRSVLANLFVNREPLRRGFISIRAMEDLSRGLLDRLGLRVDVRMPVSRLSIGEQQLVELARVLLEEPRLLILDEPNSALTEPETRRLFDVLRQLNGRGVTMLYVSHRLEEVFAICDCVTVTRNGRDVMTRERANVTMPEVIEAMIGAPQTELFPPPLPSAGRRESSTIVVKGLSGGGLKDINFTARSGEVVGLAGLEGSGLATLLGMLFGTQRALRGKVTFPDSRGLPRSPTEAGRRGIALVPADRRRNGLMLDKSVLFNISHVAVGALKNGLPWFDHGTALDRAVRQIDRLRIKTRSPHSLVGQLSGGNQQKTVLGKWLEIEPRVILLDDPTRGVDVGAKREIYGLIRRMSADGRIILFSSTELPELIGLCDRIIVLYRGRIVGEIKGGGINERTLLHAINTGEVPQTTLQ
jgi:ABC-type sugar transport system ATPase subunit